ncbi:LytR family transcriptional attenuator [Paenibacillus taihuensis]|uniref:LytR family transcriptional attenuator n=1 Tax=Paenibacillus taihuensis TaxID=1156355 RepID=A0A3D9SJT8_9BACL|nr:LCP family protein [Paenibacillus taihuensis]REE90563.1 LytR family transcriptional attenuator [Paenibacillus taihuensis]
MARARSQQPKKRKPWKWALLGVSVAILMVVGFFIYQGVGVVQGLDGISKPQDESRFGQFEVKPEEKPPEWTGTERVNILIMGGDNRGLKKNETARSDSMMVVSVDPVTKKAHLFSVLRDTYVDIDGHGDGRINTALALGGPNLAMKTIGDLLGLNIQYYVYTDFEGFKSLIDALGGIKDFDVEKDMNYVDNADGNRYDIHLKKGIQDLDGTKALQYVRFRHDAMSDFTRTERQRKLLSAVADELKNGWNLLKMKKIVNSIQPYVESNIELTDMMKLAELGVKTSVAGQTQVPPMELLGGEKVGGASVLAVSDDGKLLAFVQDELAKDNTPAATDPAADGSTSTDGGTNAGTGSNSTSTNSGNTANGTSK